METALSWLVEPLSLPFMQRALVGAMGVAVLCAVVGTFVVLLGLALLIGYLAERTRTRFDAAVGVVFATSAAIGIALISAVRIFPDLNSYLFGNVLAIRPLDLALLGAAALLVIVVVLLLQKELVLLAFDPEMARVMGIPTRAIYYLL